MADWGGPRPGAGRKPKEGSTRVSLSTRVSAQTSEQLRGLAERSGRTLGEVIDRLVGFSIARPDFQSAFAEPVCADPAAARTDVILTATAPDGAPGAMAAIEAFAPIAPALAAVDSAIAGTDAAIADGAPPECVLAEAHATTLVEVIEAAPRDELGSL